MIGETRIGRTEELIAGDCLEYLPGLPSGSVDLVFVDPPYNIGKADWDKIDDYLSWCREWIDECSRLLKPNGAFWICHNRPLVLARLSAMVSENGRGLVNWITWDKYILGNRRGFMDGFTLSPTVRSWQPMCEYLVFHADEGEWSSQTDRTRGFIFEPLRLYLESERLRARASKEDINEWLGFRRLGGMAGRHYFSRSQWQLPTEEHYLNMRECLNALSANGSDEYLRREYEDLRREYEYLRYTFNNPGKMSSVWQISPAPKNGHPTPKPEELLRRVILATSNEGDMVLDPMMGSGTTAVICKELNRNFIGIEVETKYIAIAKRRLSTPTQRTLSVFR